MEPIKLECTYEERKSKSGSLFKCLVVKLSPNYSKLVMLDVPEQCLIETQHSQPIKADVLPFEE